MIIKSFTAESANAAMKKVRKEMGGDAIVLKTRQVTDRGRRPLVEITACIDKPTVAQASTILRSEAAGHNRLAGIERSAKSDPSIQPAVDPVPLELPAEPDHDTDDRLAEIENMLESLLKRDAAGEDEASRWGALQMVYESLRDADFPQDFTDELLRAEVSVGSNDEDVTDHARQMLVATLSGMMVPDLKIIPGDRVLFVGPSGAGKSSVMGKLAAHLVAVDGYQVKLAGLDFQKVAAHEELAGYADLLDVPLTQLVELDAHEDTNRNTITLIDAPAVPVDPDKQAEYMAAAKRVNTTHRLAIISALTRTADIDELVAPLKALEPTHLVGTMLDQTTRYGSIIAASRALDCRIALFSDSPGGLGGLKTPDPDGLVRTLLKAEVAGA